MLPSKYITPKAIKALRYSNESLIFSDAVVKYSVEQIMNVSKSVGVKK